MQTQCPHCDTQFRITEEQYQIADGLVRCGVCKETFNAFEINQHDVQLPVDQVADKPLTHDDQSNKQSIEQPVASSTARPSASEESDSPEGDSERNKESPLADASDTSDDSINDPFANLPSSSTTEEPLVSFEHEDSDTLSKDINTVDDIEANANTRHELSHDIGDETAANNPFEKHETEFDLFQTDDDETLSPDLSHSIVPEEYITEKSHSVITGALWSVAILFLALTLMAEYIWFNRNQLIQIPQAKLWVERICQLTNCEMAALRDPAQIELVTRNIYSHPNQKNTLIVAVTLINHANFAQPYPLMQIDFSDARGSVVAARRFNAQTYLQTPKKQLRLLAPETSSSFTMFIQDPGNQAMTYEFNFL